MAVLHKTHPAVDTPLKLAESLPNSPVADTLLAVGAARAVVLKAMGDPLLTGMREVEAEVVEEEVDEGRDFLSLPISVEMLKRVTVRRKRVRRRCEREKGRRGVGAGELFRYRELKSDCTRLLQTGSAPSQLDETPPSSSQDATPSAYSLVPPLRSRLATPLLTSRVSSLIRRAPLATLHHHRNGSRRR